MSQAEEMTDPRPTMGVEEEFLLVDPVTRQPVAGGPGVVARATATLGDQISCEFSQSQIEVKTPPIADAVRLRAELHRLRVAAAAAAAEEGLRVCASGTAVLGLGEPMPIGDHPRYRAGVAQYRAMMDDFVVCSAHVHVHQPDREHAVLVGNHLRPWLPVLVALSANSPFDRGRDTGYAAWRAVIRSRFPCLGPPPYAESLRHHDELAEAIAKSGAMLDANLPFWDVRPNPRLPTVEIRTMDVVADVDDAVALAVLIRALVTTATHRVTRGDPGPRPSSELLRAAYWRAARDGWAGADVHVGRLVEHIGPALEVHGDTDVVAALMRRLTRRGGGADRQRASLAKHGEFAGVVDDLVALTAGTDQVSAAQA